MKWLLAGLTAVTLGVLALFLTWFFSSLLETGHLTARLFCFACHDLIEGEPYRCGGEYYCSRECAPPFLRKEKGEA